MAVEAVAVPDQAGAEVAVPTTTQALSSLQDPVERTTKAMETNAHMDVPSMEDAELRVNAQLAQLERYFNGSLYQFLLAASVVQLSLVRKRSQEVVAATAIENELKYAIANTNE